MRAALAMNMDSAVDDSDGTQFMSLDNAYGTHFSRIYRTVYSLDRCVSACQTLCRQTGIDDPRIISASAGRPPHSILQEQILKAPTMLVIPGLDLFTEIASLFEAIPMSEPRGRQRNHLEANTHTKQYRKSSHHMTMTTEHWGQQ